ncbi:MAG: hypothetical protein Q9225_004473 [Loekoesia sp. 1 TL-2023]
MSVSSTVFRVCPFNRDSALVREPASQASNSHANSPSVKTVPGHPLLVWDDRRGVTSMLEPELLTPELDKMSPYLWMMATQSSANINALHRQIVKGRKIVITEDPRLHLIWLQDRIHIKPLPKCLLSHAFWSDVLLSPPPKSGPRQPDLVKAALGYLRSYRYLIRHESDLHIAQREDLRLVPKEVTWEQISRFLGDLGSIRDDAVSPRYAFGELRLSRLNFYGKFILRRFHYERLHVQYGSYFGQFYGPLLFVFGLFALALQAMQVELAVEQLSSATIINLQELGRVLALMALAWLALLTLALLLLFLYLFVDEWQYAIRDRLRKGVTKSMRPDNYI